MNYTEALVHLMKGKVMMYKDKMITLDRGNLTVWFDNQPVGLLILRNQEEKAWSLL